jgi:hypothetical protein
MKIILTGTKKLLSDTGSITAYRFRMSAKLRL